eukprot:5014749-Prymnesium_polylepis.1
MGPHASATSLTTAVAVPLGGTTPSGVIAERQSKVGRSGAGAASAQSTRSAGTAESFVTLTLAVNGAPAGAAAAVRSAALNGAGGSPRSEKHTASSAMRGSPSPSSAAPAMAVAAGEGAPFAAPSPTPLSAAVDGGGGSADGALHGSWCGAGVH